MEALALDPASLVSRPDQGVIRTACGKLCLSVNGIPLVDHF